jgi:hypothetical protein
MNGGRRVFVAEGPLWSLLVVELVAGCLTLNKRKRKRQEIVSRGYTYGAVNEVSPLHPSTFDRKTLSTPLHRLSRPRKLV